MQIQDTGDEYHCTGVLYSMTQAKARPYRPAGEWNTLEITIRGPRTVVRLKPLSHDGYLDFLQAESEGPYKSGGVWHAGDPDYDDDEKVGPSDDKLKHLFNLEDGDRVSPREKLLAKLPPEFLERQEELEGLVGSPDPIYFPDWEKIGRAAGLDPEECHVLELRAMGLSRDRAITSEAPKRRKRIQAAWRRFDRNRCMDQVTALLTNIHKA